MDDHEVTKTNIFNVALCDLPGTSIVASGPAVVYGSAKLLLIVVLPDLWTRCGSSCKVSGL
ncbi:MAG: hypothetical protein ACRDQW_14005 [Haloechinothrix sp.]